MRKETQFLNMDNYFIKYNKWLFYKIMQVWFPLQSTNVFYSFYCDCTLKAIQGSLDYVGYFKRLPRGHLSYLRPSYGLVNPPKDYIWAFQATRCLFQGCFKLPKDYIWVPEASRCLFKGCLHYLKVTHRLGKVPRDYIYQASQAT